jgi:hypothetical protein
VKAKIPMYTDLIVAVKLINCEGIVQRKNNNEYGFLDQSE